MAWKTGLSAEQRREALKQVFAQAQACVRCQELAATRKNVVFGAGNADADLMFVGEAPGASEDAAGPAVRRPGRQTARKLLGEIGLPRADVFIANVLKCRPPATATRCRWRSRTAATTSTARSS